MPNKIETDDKCRANEEYSKQLKKHVYTCFAMTLVRTLRLNDQKGTTQRRLSKGKISINRTLVGRLIS